MGGIGVVCDVGYVAVGVTAVTGVVTNVRITIGVVVRCGVGIFFVGDRVRLCCFSCWCSVVLLSVLLVVFSLRLLSLTSVLVVVVLSLLSVLWLMCIRLLLPFSLRIVSLLVSLLLTLPLSVWFVLVRLSLVLAMVVYVALLLLRDLLPFGCGSVGVGVGVINGIG